MDDELYAERVSGLVDDIRCYEDVSRMTYFAATDGCLGYTWEFFVAYGQTAIGRLLSFDWLEACLERIWIMWPDRWL